MGETVIARGLTVKPLLLGVWHPPYLFLAISQALLHSRAALEFCYSFHMMPQQPGSVVWLISAVRVLQYINSFVFFDQVRPGHPFSWPVFSDDSSFPRHTCLEDRTLPVEEAAEPDFIGRVREEGVTETPGLLWPRHGPCENLKTLSPLSQWIRKSRLSQWTHPYRPPPQWDLSPHLLCTNAGLHAATGAGFDVSNSHLSFSWQ